MTVTHFNRGPRPGNYTFEQLFDALRSEMSRHIQIDRWDVPEDLNQLSAILWARKKAGALNHITGDVHYLSFGLPPERTLITVHDLGHYTRTLQGWKKWVYGKFWLENPFFRVAHLTAISTFTKSQMVDVLGIPEHKITVIPNPVLPDFNYSPKSFPQKQPCILQIGSGSNKNLGRLIEAVKGMDVRLLLVNKLYNPSQKAQLHASGIPFEQRVDLNMEALKKAYRDCDLVFFASEYEGFGMPILEAQAVGRPLITSNLGPMPEVAGKGGAILSDPFSVESIKSSIDKVISDNQLRLSLIENGLSNVKKYHIRGVADQYLKLYNSF
jgi:glycosyltransferase involved in cell wall biosynthesis